MKGLLSILMCAVLLASCCVSTSAYAAEYNLKQMTPQVEQALLSRKARFDNLEAYKAGGVIGENNRGYVELLGLDSRAADLVGAENRDRKVIYQTIAEQNGIALQMDVIEKVFAQVQHEKARPGYKIQAFDGAWMTK